MQNTYKKLTSKNKIQTARMYFSKYVTNKE